jgi:hypothetical protein
VRNSIGLFYLLIKKERLQNQNFQGIILKLKSKLNQISWFDSRHSSGLFTFKKNIYIGYRRYVKEKIEQKHEVHFIFTILHEIGHYLVQEFSIESFGSPDFEENLELIKRENKLDLTKDELQLATEIKDLEGGFAFQKLIFGGLNFYVSDAYEEEQKKILDVQSYKNWPLFPSLTLKERRNSIGHNYKFSGILYVPRNRSMPL